MSTKPSFLPAGQRGFSLIEVLIGLLIAMIGVVIMMEVLLSSDQRTRTTSSGADATSNGAIMMYMLQRDLAQSGYGFNTTSLMGCNVTLPAGVTIPLAPVVINPDAALFPATAPAFRDANTDSLMVFYGNGAGQPEGNEIFAVVGNQYNLQSPASFAQNDWVIASGTVCAGTMTLARVTAVNLFSVNVTAALPTAKALYSLGPAPKVVMYAIHNGALTSCDYMVADCRVASNWAEVAGGVVSLRAQYGRDTVAPSDGFVDTWDQSALVATDKCTRARTPAVRLALVARSGQYESTIGAGGQRTGEQVTTDALKPTWAGQAAAPIDLSALPDWRSYRYRTFETVVPSRNLVWMGPQGC